MLNSFASAPACAFTLAELFNARPIGSALFNPFVYIVVRRQSPSHGLKTPVDRFCGATR
jgi:hypothetical protein